MIGTQNRNELVVASNSCKWLNNENILTRVLRGDDTFAPLARDILSQEPLRIAVGIDVGYDGRDVEKAVKGEPNAGERCGQVKRKCSHSTSVIKVATFLMVGVKDLLAGLLVVAKALSDGGAVQCH